MALKSTHGLFARGIGIAATATIGLFGRGIGVGSSSTPTTAVGATVHPFTVQQAAQLFKKVAWDEQAKSQPPVPDSRVSRYDLAQPTMAQQRQRIEATKQARANDRAERETMVWIASILPQLEDMSD